MEVYMQLQEHDGKKVTRQEGLLLQAYTILEKHKSDLAGTNFHSLSIVPPSSVHPSTQRLPRSPKSNISLSSTKRRLSETKDSTQNPIARVQQFLAKKNSSSSSTPATKASKIDKVKALLSRQNAKTGSSPSASRRPMKNPLAEIIGSSAVASTISSVASNTQQNKRPRRQSDMNSKQCGPTVVLQLPPESYLRQSDWNSFQDAPLDVPLHAPAFDGNNTLVINATMPSRAQRCSFNICSEDKSGTKNILYHFNPRRSRNGQIIQNTKIDERWGLIETLHRFPIQYGAPFQLRITLTRNGFAVFFGDQFQTEYQHRVPLKEGDVIYLNLPTQDDYGNQEGVIVHSIWWGHADPTATNPSHGNSHALKQKQYEERRFDVYLGGITSDITRADVEELFSSLTVENIRLMPSKGYGFVSLKNTDEVDQAIEHINGKTVKGIVVRVSRARGSVAPTTMVPPPTLA